MSHTGSLEEIASVISRFSSAVVLAHTNPDADAFGSSCGLALGLRNCGFSTRIINEGGSIARYSIIPGVSEVSSTLPETFESDTVVIVCDCGAIERVGDTLVDKIRSAHTVVNVDHHHANSLFGTTNWIDEGASSTSEMVYWLLRSLEESKQAGQFISKEVALALLAGIIGDTGSFRYPSTTDRTFEAAAELYRRGARSTEIVQGLFASISRAAIRLQSEALSAMSVHADGAIAVVVVSSQLVQRCGAEMSDADSLAERARDVEGVQVAALLKEDEGVWRVSLRARSPTFDVSMVARSFGGGGHKAAAAFRWRQGLARLHEELLLRLTSLVKGEFVFTE
jgi:phosphoesterase RecJ-like protein